MNSIPVTMPGAAAAIGGLQTPRRTRAALAEIARTSPQATVVVEDMNDNDETNVMNINGMITDTDEDGTVIATITIPNGIPTPSPSPDELLIQMRGRKNTPLTWSPINAPTPRRDKTPTKRNSFNRLFPLRASPRKRLQLGEPQEPPVTNGRNKKSSPILKKQRFEIDISPIPPLEMALKGLSQEQLVGVLQNLVLSHPELRHEVEESLPPPDLRPMEEKLNYLKKNIFRALPNSRLTSKTDSPAYNRVSTHLLSFKKAVIEQGKQLLDSQHWCSVVEYVLLAWIYVRATPVWDNPPHNAIRRQCFKSLAAQCLTALRSGSWDVDGYDRIKLRLDSLKLDSDEILPCLKYLSSIEHD